MWQSLCSLAFPVCITVTVKISTSYLCGNNLGILVGRHSKSEWFIRSLFQDWEERQSYPQGSQASGKGIRCSICNKSTCGSLLCGNVLGNKGTAESMKVLSARKHS